MVHKGDDMTELTIFGTAASRTYRTLWMAKEVAADYTHDPVDHRSGGTKTPDYLALNPNAQVPSMRDGDFVLWQSFAINLYLAQKYQTPVSPANLEEEMLAVQWSLWALVEIEAFVADLAQELQKPPAEQSADVNEHLRQKLPKPLAVLDGVLAEREFLVADRFTVADLNTAATLRPLARIDQELTPYPHAERWFDACFSRPAAKEAIALQREAMARL
jgi:glutathione S-transferase